MSWSRWVMAVIVSLLALPATAPGHASLDSSVPRIDEVVEEAPGTLQLRFSGPVTLRDDAFRIMEPAGGAISVADASAAPDPTDPAFSVVTVDPEETLPRGTHTLDWTVYSDHGDPIRGLLPFHVEERSAGDAAARRGAMRAAVAEDLADERRADRLRIGIPALLAAALVLFAMAARPAWRLPASLVLVIIVVIAFGLGRRSGSDDGVAIGASTRTQLTGGEALTLTIDPASVGANDVLVEIAGTGDGGSPISDVELRATPAGDDHGPMRVAFEADGKGRFVIRDQTFPIAGIWSLAITSTRSSGEGQQIVLDVPIAASSNEQGS